MATRNSAAAEASLNSWVRGETTSQYRARTTPACAVTDCGMRRSTPAACVRTWVAKKMISCRSEGNALKDVRWYS